jgi:hypothetical protein
MRDVKLVLEPEEPSDATFLDALREAGTETYIAFETNVGLCRVVEGTYVMGQGKRHWLVNARLENSDFTPLFEMAFSSTSADELAEMRARRLLLNEYPSKDTTDINELTKEVFLRGQNTPLAILRSGFPSLYQQYGKDPSRFLEFAWITAVFQLKLSACVAEVRHLSLKLEDHLLHVDFRGRRKKTYVNAPAYEIAVRGTCWLRPQ